MADRPTLEETIALLEATLEATHDGILVVDLDRHIIRYNRHYLKMFGLTSDDLERGGVDGLIETLSPELEDLESVLLRSHAIWSDPSSEVMDILHKSSTAAAQMTVHRALVALAREMGHERRA